MPDNTQDPTQGTQQTIAPPPGMVPVPMPLDNDPLAAYKDELAMATDSGTYTDPQDAAPSVNSDSSDGLAGMSDVFGVPGATPGMSDDDTFGVPAPQSQPATENPESLERQNIFDLLGIANGSDEDKEKFLDELQQVIWIDFLDRDVRLLLTEEETQKVTELRGQNASAKLEEQEELVTYLEKLIPDLEDIMLEKAIELKEEMVRERVSGLRELFQGQAQKLQVLSEVEQLMDSNMWLQVGTKLNSLS